MVEDVARTVHIARQGGELVPLAPEAIDALFDRYQNVYGQQPATTPSTPGAHSLEPSQHHS
jgi:L-ribulose-5-phosphate 4-epimerase